MVEEGQKGVAAVQVKEEKGGVPAEEAPAEDEGEREMGKVKVISPQNWAQGLSLP